MKIFNYFVYSNQNAEHYVLLLLIIPHINIDKVCIGTLYLIKETVTLKSAVLDGKNVTLMHLSLGNNFAPASKLPGFIQYLFFWCAHAFRFHHKTCSFCIGRYIWSENQRRNKEKTLPIFSFQSWKSVRFYYILRNAHYQHFRDFVRYSNSLTINLFVNPIGVFTTIFYHIFRIFPILFWGSE